MDLLERGAELDQLEELLVEAAGGRGRVAMLAGEAGIGKTALVQQFCSSVANRATILIGACDPLSTPTPLGPLLDIAASLGGEFQRELGQQAARQHVFSALLAELSRGSRPWILVFEDVHWADEATLDLLRFLARRLDTRQVLLIATYREDEVGPRHPLRVVLGDVATTGVVRRLRLHPLSQAAVAILAAGQDVDPVELHRRTDGIPFYVTEVLAASLSGVPATIGDTVLARVARLSDPVRRALEAAAVVGQRCRPQLLQQVAAVDSETLDACVEAGVLTTDGVSFVFHHELVREAILDVMPAGRRTLLHQRVLRALIEAGVRDDLFARLAHHADASADGEAVVKYAAAAGRRASELGAHREASAQYARALRYSDTLSPAERARLLDAYASACADTKQLDQAIDARQQAIALWQALGEQHRQGDSLTRLAGPLVTTGRKSEAEAASLASLAVLEALPPSRELARACATQGGLRMRSHDDAQAIAWGERAIGLAEQFGAVESLALALNHTGAARLHRDDDRGRADLERSITLAREHGLEGLVAQGYFNLGCLCAEHYQLQRAEAYLDQGIAFCADRDLDRWQDGLLAWRALVQVFQGKWDTAIETATSIARNAQRTNDAAIAALLAMGRVWTRQGDPRAQATLDEALQLAQATDELQNLGPVRAARAELAWWAEDSAAVRAEVIAVLELALAREQSWLVGELAFWLWRSGHAASGSGAAEPFARQIAGDWTAAADLWRELGCPYEHACAQAESDEVATLRQALLSANDLRARPLAARVVRSLRRLGARPASPRPLPETTEATASPLARLSPREREVANLIAQGLTNRHIAQRLVISERTTENHVQRILNRLGLQSRTQVAAWAVRHGLGGVTGQQLNS